MKLTEALAIAGVCVAISGPVLAQSVRGIEHIGITVPSLDEASSYFVSAFGCEEAIRVGPLLDPNGNWMETTLGTHPRAELNIAVLACGNSSNIELFEFESPTQNANVPKRDDLGAASIGFYTDDLEGSIEAIRQAGGSILGEITSIGDGPFAGRDFIYSTTPWGQLVFLANDGNGIAYSRENPAVELYSPAEHPLRGE